MMITRESDYAIRIIRALKDGGTASPGTDMPAGTGAETVCIQDTEKAGAFRPGIHTQGRRRRMYSEPKPGGSDPPGYH